MSFLPTPSKNNQLLRQLSAKTSRLLSAQARPTDLDFGQELGEAGSPVSRVLFPTTAVISLTIQVDDRKPLEISMIGREGMLGAALSQGIEHHPVRAFVKAAGEAIEFSSSAFLEQIRACEDLRHVVDRYLFVYAQQLAQAAACNVFHELPTRLAVWLLRTDDRDGLTNSTFTQQFLSEQLGVRRSAVSIAAGLLQKQKMIRYTRGHIELLARSGLEERACKCYAKDLEYYRNQFPVTRRK